ncbi:signal peptidase I [Erythrobacter sp. HL-111]|uniref:signal peptidase I n=1 Tax=Erythrobacter sp. HL-111 TaxID=1798193 RepID=UPI0006DA9211|nr:signal peptidase I [Erythrobacter sp. HL-111]KPP80916.1 MAG: signal peptidase I LepB [Erythrobacteraceae bacterium HL-111]SDR82910.1 signal peptidase I Serine peptidase. MEROPS family S26A [Erythrobacter sp. HL-111]
MDVKTQSVPGDTASVGESRGRDESWLGFARFLLLVLLAVLAFRTLVVSPFSIPSESMLPRLVNGDYLLATKWSYGYSRHSLPFDAPVMQGRLLARMPERGDIVIFKHPLDRSDYVKRVIGLPGDSVGVVGGQVVLNGAFVPREPLADFELAVSPNTTCAWGGERVRRGDGRDVCAYSRFRETLPGGRRYEVLDFGPTSADSFAPVTVPEGHMFVLGDNRDNSRDSRFPAVVGDAVGIVPLENLVGRASVIMWSTDGSAEWLKPWTWLTAARGERIGQVL